ncbi:MAG TPA: CHAD domain-containing protein [Anaerolineaceae bacterium]|nr:CHAD domain-containing protein [Anaerolineaceae bacterium]
MSATAEATCVYGAKIIQRHLAAMAAEVEGVRAAEDIECIHRMRVATRRMRTALTLFSDCFPKQDYKKIQKDVRKVTRALGEARDLDVQLEVIEAALEEFPDPVFQPGIKRLKLRLTQRRAEVQQHVDAAMDKMLADQLIERLEAWAAPLLEQSKSVYLYTPALYQLAFRGIQVRIDELLSHVPYITDPQNVQELHAMRISAKRLRYAMETFEELYGGQLKPFITTARKLQDQLGAIHDLDVWIVMIPQFIEEERARIVGYFGNVRPLRRLLPGLEAFRQSRIALREAGYANFLKEWAKIEEEQTWDKLLKLINTPMDLEAAVQARKAEEKPKDNPLEE